MVVDMVINQNIVKKYLSNKMELGRWYQVKELIILFEQIYDNFQEEDLQPLDSEPNRPRWHRLVTNSVRLSPGRNDYPSNSWAELKVRKISRNFEYSIPNIDLVESSIVRDSRDDDGSGHIYAIVNNAWDHWVKIGKTIDINQRLQSYQTYTPMKDYRLLHEVNVIDRHIAETYIHRLASDISEQPSNGEWFKISNKDEIISLFDRINNF